MNKTLIRITVKDLGLQPGTSDWFLLRIVPGYSKEELIAGTLCLIALGSFLVPGTS